MRTLFLTSNGLNEKTTPLFWEYVGKEPIDTKAILVPSAAVENDGAREGIIVCMERLMNMGISVNSILIYDLALLLSDGYKRTYSSYVRDIPAQLRLMNARELAQYDVIAFCGGNARTLLDEVNRTGLSEPLKQAIEWNKRRKYDSSRKFCRQFGLSGKSIDTPCRKRKSLRRNIQGGFDRISRWTNSIDQRRMSGNYLLKWSSWRRHYE